MHLASRAAALPRGIDPLLASYLPPRWEDNGRTACTCLSAEDETGGAGLIHRSSWRWYQRAT